MKSYHILSFKTWKIVLNLCKNITNSLIHSLSAEGRCIIRIFKINLRQDIYCRINMKYNALVLHLFLSMLERYTKRGRLLKYSVSFA